VSDPITWLYVPGDRPERFAKAAASGADVVIVDLEDAVAADHKDAARRNAVAWLADAAPGSVEIRVNAAGTPWHEADLQALEALEAPGALEALPADGALRAVRVPKVESAEAVRRVATRVPVPIVCLLETALGVESAFEIARCGNVAAIGLGEADLAGDLDVRTAAALTWARSRVVVAARAAGLPSPAMSVHPHVHDDAGLRASSLAGRDLGFFGRAAIHPRQLPVITEVFAVDADELRDAEVVLAALDEAVARGSGVTVLPDGRMLDAAMLAQARRTIARARR